MIIERVVVVPQGPTVGQTRPARPCPTRSPARAASTRGRSGRSRSMSRIGTARPGGPRLVRPGVCSTRPAGVGIFVVRFGEWYVSRSTTNIQPSGRLTIMRTTAGIDCGPQDSNLQPRDSRALAFPRGLDYLILLFTNAAADSIDQFARQMGGASQRGGRALAAGIIVGTHPASL